MLLPRVYKKLIHILIIKRQILPTYDGEVFLVGA